MFVFFNEAKLGLVQKHGILSKNIAAFVHSVPPLRKILVCNFVSY